MTEHKRKWWLIPAAVILGAVLLLGIFWDAAAVHLAPKAVLTATLTNTFAKLEQRFSGSPLHILGRGLDPEGKNTIQLALDTTDELLGDMSYHMAIQTDGAAGMAFAKGTVTTKGNILDLSLYADREFAAVSSDSLLKGSFYGITYDTFSEDIRKDQLLSFMLGEETISQWEQSVSSLAEQMGRSFTMPEISKNDISMAMVGILTLKAQVAQEVQTVNAEALDCFAVSFQAEGEDILSAASYAGISLPLAIDTSSVLTATFYIHEDVVAWIELTVTGPEKCQVILSLGDDPKRDDLILTATVVGADTIKSYHGVLKTDLSEAYHSDTFYLSSTVDGVQEDTVIGYDYSPVSGAVKLRRDDREAAFTLTEAEDGFRLETADMGALLAILMDGEDKGDSPATMTVMKGSDIVTPDYKNFDLWSMEDLLTLLGGIGSLFGLKIA